MYDINPPVILEAAIKAYGEKVQVTPPLWIDLISESVTVGVTQFHGRSFNGKFYYKKGSFDANAQDK